jgi:ergothioneine biosynthesis protein EgtB
MDARSGRSADSAGEAGPNGAAPDAARRALAADMRACRSATLALFREIPAELFRRQLHPLYSPLGWHLGHIAYTEGLWLLGETNAVTTPDLRRAFAVDGLDKSERTAIPDAPAVFAYVARMRQATLARLADPAAAIDLRLWRFVLQHEAQHAETASFLAALARRDTAPAAIAPDTKPVDYVAVPGGLAAIGSDDAEALDNERDPHAVALRAFRLARHPVTQAQFAAFMADGGYERRELWCRAGWAWRVAESIERPFHWRAAAPEHPVAGVSAHEAEAYCRWAGARLPSEFEWEHAARGLVATMRSGNLGGIARGTAPVGGFPEGRSVDGAEDLFGNVWEWTASEFVPYSGFEAWPYEGYSARWFDGRHRVLRGGSWATRIFALRRSFRNWYVPETRQIFAGFRPARDL